MNPLSIIKTIVDVTISFGIGSITGNVVKSFAPTEMNLIKKISVFVGSYFLSSMITSKVTEHAEKQIDSVAENISKLRQTLKELANKEEN